jgi:murein DD-endopeptidase MepM/ murein hydrolase activator NlpD
MAASWRLYAYFFVFFFLVVFLHWSLGAIRFFFFGGGVGYSYRSDAPALRMIDFSAFSETIKPSYISQGYGSTMFARLSNYVDHRHNGIDIVAPEGAPILSATEGKVLALGNQDKFCPGRNYGKFLVIGNAKDGTVLLYAHLGSFKVKEGDSVEKGKIIATVGKSGFITSPHLHISVFEGEGFRMAKKEGCGPNPEGRDVNPIKYLESLD